ncbi:MAG TPA: acyl-CoA dehydrogenase family protein [Ilumatobacteraceae bacterium]|nr:acyl-CoA dehydrogenase family protein [Ilumatobacteraceae bacterium]
MAPSSPELSPAAGDAVAVAGRLADDVLFPAAQDVDRADRVPDRNLVALADAGLFGLAGPASHGGLDLDGRAARRAMAAVGSGCGATFFVWVQHHGVVRTLRSADNVALLEEHLADLCVGRSLAGTAFAHVRRPGRPAISATRIDGGWSLSGHAPWATSWGLADWFSVAAESDGGELVWALIPGRSPQGVSATALALPVFGATATVALHFDRCVVSDERVITVESAEGWRRADRRHASLGQPAVLGVVARAQRLLADGHDDLAVAAAECLAAELRSRWQIDDDLMGSLAAGNDVVADASDHRAACLDLARRSTTGLLAAVGGRGMDLSHPAQRLAREADFYVIQAQTADGRAATLRSVAVTPPTH